MIFRPALKNELDQVLSITVTEPVNWVDADRFRTDFEADQYRLENTWLAVEDDQILARAIWWAMTDEPHPYALDCLWVHERFTERTTVAAGLLAAAHADFLARGVTEKPGYRFSLDTDWRSSSAVTAAIGWRRQALHRVGLTEELERFLFEWTPSTGVPGDSGRLRFDTADDPTFLKVCMRLAEGSLDVGTIKDTATMGLEASVQQDFDRNRAMPGDRDHWRIAYTPEGELVGMVMPSANAAGPVIAYIGVVPEFRGHGYVHDLLAEGTRILAEAGADRIRAGTDMGNRPMADAFGRAGYRHRATSLILDAPAN